MEYWYPRWGFLFFIFFIRQKVWCGLIIQFIAYNYWSSNRRPKVLLVEDPYGFFGGYVSMKKIPIFSPFFSPSFFSRNFVSKIFPPSFISGFSSIFFFLKFISPDFIPQFFFHVFLRSYRRSSVYSDRVFFVVRRLVVGVTHTQ